MMFTAALLIIAKIWKPPRCPTVGEWMKIWYRQWNIIQHKKEMSYEAIKKIQSETAVYYMVPNI